MGVIHNIIGGIDLSDVTLDSASKLLYGVKAYDKDENLITGDMPNNGAYTATGKPSGNNTVDVPIPAGYHNGSGHITADGTDSYSAGDTAGYARGVSETKKGTASTAQVLSGYTFTNSSTVNASGSMTDRGAWTGTGTPTGNNQTNVTIPKGYHNGSGYVTCKGQTAYNAGYSAGSSASAASRVTLWTGSHRGSNLSVNLSGYSWVYVTVGNATYNGCTLLQVGGAVQCASILQSVEDSWRSYTIPLKATTSGIQKQDASWPADDKATLYITGVYGIKNLS